MMEAGHMQARCQVVGSTFEKLGRCILVAAPPSCPWIMLSSRQASLSNCPNFYSLHVFTHRTLVVCGPLINGNGSHPAPGPQRRPQPVRCGGNSQLPRHRCVITASTKRQTSSVDQVPGNHDDDADHA